MKYDREARLREIMRRSEMIKNRKEHKKLYSLTASASAILLVLAAFIVDLGGIEAAGTEWTAYGSFLLSPQAGGYVLIAVIAFGVGVLSTLLTQKYRKGGKRGHGNGDKE